MKTADGGKGNKNRNNLCKKNKSSKKFQVKDIGIEHGLSSIEGNSFKDKKLKRKKGQKDKKKGSKLVKLIGEEYGNIRGGGGGGGEPLEEEQEVINLDDEEDLEDELVEPEDKMLTKKKIVKEQVKRKLSVSVNVKKVKKKSKIPKIRRSATSERTEENFMIVPWESSDEWNEVCRQLHCRAYEDVISKIAVWQRRVPSLPVGVEATFFLLEALLYDQKLLRIVTSSNNSKGFYTEGQARALYSLAIIRYLNHVNHLAAQSLGESSSRPALELAAIMDTPDWLVSLRNDVSHGPKAPSLESLRMGGHFVLQWLEEKYWKLPEENQMSNSTNDPFTVLGPAEIVDVPREISRLLVAYVASRIYKKRHQNTISDADIICHIPSASLSVPVKTKVAVITLKTSLKNFLISYPSQFCMTVSQELIPSAEFYENFSAIFRKKSKGAGTESMDIEDDQNQTFEQFYGIWMPIIKLLESKAKLMSVLNNLCEVMVHPDQEKLWMFCAKWINKILEIIETSGKRYSKQLTVLLKELVKHPNIYMQLFLDRLFRLTEPRIGSEAIEKLSLLVNIWLEENGETRGRKKKAGKLFTLTDLEGQNGSSEIETDVLGYDNPAESVGWTPDRRGGDFWRNIPLGGVL